MAGNSVPNQLSNLRPIIIAMMKREGRSLKVCEVGNHPIKGRFELHHTRYESATYKDLRIACSKCNHAPENVLLT